MGETYFGYRLLLLILILGLNGFFASAEVALLSVRQSRLKELVAEGHVGAQAALSLLKRPERLLSVVQVGVTLASLGLGWAGEEAVYQLIVRALQPVLTPNTSSVLHAVSFTAAFLAISYAHVVIGEVVPKNLAIEKADRLAIIVAPALLVFCRISLPFVYIAERSAAGISRLLGLHGEQRGGGHSAEELKLIISSNRGPGGLPEFEEETIGRLLDLQTLSAREIMTPRNDVVSISVEATLEQALRTVIECQYSRFPIYEGSPERIVGIMHAKDLLRVWERTRTARQLHTPVSHFRLKSLLRKHLVVPETKPLNQMIEEFRQNRAHMAMVVDEFGTIVGLVTLEDVLEQIFGEIEDEYDLKRQLPDQAAPVLQLEGTFSIRDLETQYGIALPIDAGFETLAGFLLFRVGHIPKAGETVDFEGRRFTVLSMDRNRIARVLIEKMM